MNPAFKLARYYGVTVAFADLGEWGVDELRSEYDPEGPSVRINSRIMETLLPDEAGEFITMALGHELYHHREHIGEVERMPSRVDREKAAVAFARELMQRS